jgi:hypothetical protein
MAHKCSTRFDLKLKWVCGFSTFRMPCMNEWNVNPCFNCTRFAYWKKGSKWLFISSSIIILLVRTPCIMHMCVISTMFGWCFWFFKKTFLFKQLLVLPPPRPSPSHFPFRFFTPSTPHARSFAFPTPFLYPVHPPPHPVLRISHSGFLTHRTPRPVLHISHSGSLTCQSPSAGPSHFPLRFFNPSIPPCSVLHISHSGFLTFRFRFLRTQHEQKNRRFLSFQQPCRANGFRGRTATSLADSLTLSLFWSP